METIIKGFSVESEPPTAEDIEKTRNYYMKRSLREFKIFSLAAALLVFGFITLSVFSHVINGTSIMRGQLIILIALVIPVAIFIAFAVNPETLYKLYRDQNFKLRATFVPKTIVCLDFLEPIEKPSHVKEVIDMCEKSSVIATYQNKAATQRRFLVEGEYEAMKNYLLHTKEQLLEPIAYKGEK